MKLTRSLRSNLVLSAALLALAGALGPALPARAEGEVQITRDVVYGHKDGMALIYDVLKPANPNGAAIAYMVSGGWFSRWAPPEQRVAMFRELLDRGFTVAAIHHGSAPRFKVPEAVEDVRRAIRHLRQNAATYGFDPQRMGVFGGSAGGHLSLMLGLAGDAGDPAAQDPVLRVSDAVQVVVAYYPPVDLRPIVGPSERFPALDFPKEQAEKISPITFVTPDDPPTLLIHGDADQLVNVSNSKRMYEALQAAKVESKMIIIEGGDHGFRKAEHRSRAGAAMAEWFDQHLGRKASGKTAAKRD
jgi:acetyl esterase/lipase